MRVQAGVYPNVFAAASSITDAAGVRGLFTGCAMSSPHSCMRLD